MKSILKTNSAQTQVVISEARSLLQEGKNEDQVYMQLCKTVKTHGMMHILEIVEAVFDGETTGCTSWWTIDSQTIQSACGKYEVSQLCEPTEEGNFTASRKNWNQYLGTGSRKSMQELCHEHNTTN